MVYNEYQEAAQKILEADFLLVAAGSSFSADSNVRTYEQLLEHPAFKSQNMRLEDVVTTKLLAKDPELFYGFWGSLFNDAMEKSPHGGYDKLFNWKIDLFSVNSQTGALTRRMRKLMELDDDDDMALAGPFYIITTTIDNHFKRTFEDNEVWEMSGNVVGWQCSVGCTNDLWDAPQTYRFEVDPEKMRIADKSFTGNKKQPYDDKDDDDDEEEDEENGDEEKVEGFQHKFPTCIECGALARPNVEMISDPEWVSNEQTDATLFRIWRDAVKDLVTASSGDKQPSVVILEIGCPNDTKSARNETVTFIRSMNNILKASGRAAKSNATLIRINALPGPVEEDIKDQVMVFEDSGLEALCSIDRKLKRLRKAAGHVLSDEEIDSHEETDDD